MLSSVIQKKTIALALVLFILSTEVVRAAGITIGSGATVTESGSPTITTNGDWDNNGTFVPGAGTVVLNGLTSTFLEAGSSSFNHLTVNKTDGGGANDNVTVQTQDLSVAGTLTVTDGELVQGVTNFTLSALVMAAAGQYTNSSTGDLTLSGSVSNAGSIAFDANGGGAGSADDILIRSSVNGVQRNWQGAGTFSMTDVNVKDQTALGGTPANITVSSGTNAGNNINWLFGGVTIAGTAYTSKAELGTLNNKALRIAQYHAGNLTTYTTTTDGSGAFSLSMTDAQDGDPIVIYLNDEAEEGNLVYISDGLSVSNLKLYQNEVSLRNDSGAGITNANLANVDDGDDDIKYNVASGNATFESAFELFVFTGSTYAPGGAASFTDLDLNGAFSMSTHAITCSGTWDASGGAYTSAGTVTFAATSAKNLTTNGGSALASFNHVIFSGVGGQWNLQDGADVDGDLTISQGTLNANSQNINVAGNWTNTASFTSASGTVIFDGTGTQVFTSTGTGIAADDTARDFDNLTISGNTLQIASGSELEVDGTLQINASKILDVNAQTLDLNGTLSNDGVVALEGSETIGLGTWDTNSGTVRYYGDSVTIFSILPAYFDLEFDEVVNGQTYTFPDTALTINGRWLVTDGIVAFDDDKNVTVNDNGATGTALVVAAAGTLNNTGTGDLSIKGAVSNAGAVTFNSSDDAGNGISILSVGSPTQRNWQGSGAFSMTDVTVQDQTVTGGTPASISAISSASGGNNLNWLFGGGALSGVTVTPANLEANHTSANTIVFTTASALASNGKVRITFPAGFNVASVTTATSASDLNGSFAVSVSGQDVTITRSGGTNFTAGGTVDDLVLNGVVNPVAVGLTGTFTVSTLDSANNIIDTGSAPGVTIIPSTSTASSASFIDSNGTVVTGYTLGSTTTGLIYLRINDFDENANALAAETVTVTLTSGKTGDTETVTLTETGVNTGIFQNTASGKAYDADDAPVSGNGLFETRDNDSITMSYVDNDDGTDTSSVSSQVRASQQQIIATISATPTNIAVGEVITLLGTIENRTSETLSNFRLVAQLPPGLSLQPGSAETDAGSISIDSSSGAFVNVSTLAAGEKRSIKFKVVAGSAARPGSFPVSFFAQINPIISNTAQVTLQIKPDPIFNIGTLIGKVFWDINKNGVQDDGEIGIPNAVLATEQGYVITTDQFGRYHIPDFLSGRHMVKIDRNSLPDGSHLTTPEAVVVSQTDAMLTKVNFGVLIPEEAAAQYDIERETDITLQLRKDTAAPQKAFALEFHEIRLRRNEPGLKQDDKLTLLAKSELELIEGGSYEVKNSEEYPVLPFRINMNYAKFVKKWSFELSRYEVPENTLAIPQDPKDRKRESVSLAKEEGEPTAAAFRYTWKHPLTEKVKGEERPVNYEVRVTLIDEKGNEDTAIYDLVPDVTEETITWRLDPVDMVQTIPIKGSAVIIDGKTHANKIVSVAGRETLTSSDGSFTSQVILPEGKREIPVLLYMKPDEKPIKILRQVDVRDTYLFWVGFSEMEWGKLDIKGNVNSVTAEDKARFQSKWYDESRIAYYLKGKIKGKYLITASVDTQREKKDLFRNLEPDDYYAVYGDRSNVTADANDTQDKYFLLIEADKSFFKYGNFDTGFTGTQLADFSRTLHGAKGHYETLSTAPDGKAVTFVTAFTAQARQGAARNEYLATGSVLYYMKHKDVVMSSEKIKLVVRDKVSGIPLSETTLNRQTDYDIDYDEGRVRLNRPASTFTFGSGSILSTNLFAGDPQYLVIDYEFETTEFLRDRTSGARASHAFLGERVRVGGTYVSEEKQMKNFELRGADTSVTLPLDTEVRAEYASSTLQATGEFISTDGGLSFNEVVRPNGGGEAYLMEINSSPVSNLSLAAYYRTLGTGFSSSGTISESGTDKYGLAADYTTSGWGEFHFKHEFMRTAGGASSPSAIYAETIPSSQQEALERQYTDWFQYKFDRGRWGVTAEYRDTQQTGANEHLAGIEGRYDINDKTKLSVAAQKSLTGEDNDQIRATVSRKISENLSVEATQAYGNKGVGSQVGLQSGFFGQQRLFTKAFGFMKDESKKEEAATEVGFTRKLSKDTEVKFGKKVGSKSAGGQSFHLTRATDDGRTLELSQDTDGATSTTAYTETRNINENISEYNSTTTATNKAAGTTVQTKVHGIKANILQGRGALYQEDQTSTAAGAERAGTKTGGKVMIGEFDTVEFAYQHLMDKTAEIKTESQAVNFVYDYFDYDKLRATSSWDFRTEDGAQKTIQLLSTGRAEYFINAEWAWVGRYEWSYTEDLIRKVQEAHFSEFQTGVAYRPVKNDKLNLFLEYKYLNDAGLTGQLDLNSEDRTVRQVARAELAYDIHPKVTFVEKLALRSTDTLFATGTRSESLSFLAAQRVNLHITERFDLAGEYRYMGQTLAKDSSQGILVEANYRLTDALRLAIGYNTVRFDSQTASDLNVETSGFYVRIFYDAIEELRGVMEKKRKKTQEAAGSLEEELEKVVAMKGDEKAVLEINKRLAYARDLMEKMLYDEAIEVLQDGLERYEAARLYADRAEKQRAQFDFYLKQGRMLSKYGLHQKAFQSFEKAYRINAFDEELLENMSGTRREIQRVLEVRREIRNKQRKVFERLKKMPDAADVLRETIHMHYETGKTYFEKGLDEDAMQEWQRGFELAKKIDSYQAAAVSDRKDLMEKLGKINEAAKKSYEAGDYEKAKDKIKEGADLVKRSQ